MKEAVNMKRFGTILMLIVMFCFTGHAQNNSPWRKINDEILIVKNVYFAPGCHQYSLTGGQGFSIYIKNKNLQTVFIKENLIARTYCGKDIVSPFKVTLKANEFSNGGSYDDPNNNGQAGVISPAECKGVAYLVRINKPLYKKARYIRYSNRIKTVKVTNVEVMFTDTVLAKKKTEILSPITPAAKSDNYDSLVNQKLFVFEHVDSLKKEIRTLEKVNNNLSDSLSYYKFMNDQLKSYIQIKEQPQPTQQTITKKSRRKKNKTATTNAADLQNK